MVKCSLYLEIPEIYKGVGEGDIIFSLTWRKLSQSNNKLFPQKRLSLNKGLDSFISLIFISLYDTIQV